METNDVSTHRVAAVLHREWRTICGLLLGLAFALAAPAQSIQRPADPDGGPTEVRVAIALLDIDEINSADQNFTVNLFIRASWQDPRLALEGAAKRTLPLNTVWHPQLQFLNQQKIWPTFPEVVQVAADGSVEYAQRIWGPFSQRLEVQDFPFDAHDFVVRVVAAGAGPDEVNFTPDTANRSGLAPEFSLPDWEVLDWKVDCRSYRVMTDSEAMPSFALVLHARRYVSHHVLKTILPLVLIVVMSWIVFWIDPSESGVQIGVATTSMLTLIAYRFSIGNSIPPVPYLTRLDRFILVSTVLVFVALAQAVITSIMAKHEKQHAARWLDRICRVLFPVFFALITYLTLLT